MREAAFCCCICDMWGSSQGRETNVYTASQNSSATGGARSGGLCKPAMGYRSRDWICVETGGAPAEALSEVSLLCPRCAFTVPSRDG
jgi:hypothetical protein